LLKYSIILKKKEEECCKQSQFDFFNKFCWSILLFLKNGSCKQSQFEFFNKFCWNILLFWKNGVIQSQFEFFRILIVEEDKSIRSSFYFVVLKPMGGQWFLSWRHVEKGTRRKTNGPMLNKFNHMLQNISLWKKRFLCKTYVRAKGFRNLWIYQVCWFLQELTFKGPRILKCWQNSKVFLFFEFWTCLITSLGKWFASWTTIGSIPNTNFLRYNQLLRREEIVLKNQMNATMLIYK